MVLVAWLVVANRAPSLEPFALERNLGAAVALGLLPPFLSFASCDFRALSLLLAWSAGASRRSPTVCWVFILGLALGLVRCTLHVGDNSLYDFATLSWIGTCISRARESDVSH